MKKAVENWAPKKLAPAENRAAEKKTVEENCAPTNSASAENCASEKEAVENCVPSKRA
jgi:hypothetical protein